LEDLAAEAPAPEKKGEIATLLRGTERTPDWLDGYLAAVVIAPKMLMPNDWLPAILNAVLPRIDPARFQRFLDLVMMRVQAASYLAADPEAFLASMAGRTKKRQANWAAGFSQATDTFRSAWPKKGLTEEDRRLLAMVSEGRVPGELAEFATLIASRQIRNAG
jgi:yecA family protein